MKKGICLLMLLSLLVAAGTAFAADKTYTWKISHIRPADTAIDKDVKWFAEKLNKESNGRITIDVFNAGQLGDYTVVQERISVGAIDMAIQPVGTTADKRLQILNFPYLVKDWDGVKKNYTTGSPLMKTAADLFAKQNIKLIAVWPVYFGGIALVKNPEKPGDPNVAKNMKVRIPTQKSFELLAGSFGYQATPLPFAETFTAIQTGIVDGAFGAGAEGYYANFRDIIKYYVPANTHFEQWYFLMSMELWESLSKEDQTLVQKIAKEMEDRRVSVAEADQKANEQKMRDYKITVLDMAPADLERLEKKAREVVWPSLRKDIGEKFFDEIVTNLVK